MIGTRTMHGLCLRFYRFFDGVWTESAIDPAYAEHISGGFPGTPRDAVFAHPMDAGPVIDRGLGDCESGSLD